MTPERRPGQEKRGGPRESRDVFVAMEAMNDLKGNPDWGGINALPIPLQVHRIPIRSDVIKITVVRL